MYADNKQQDIVTGLVEASLGESERLRQVQKENKRLVQENALLKERYTYDEQQQLPEEPQAGAPAEERVAWLEAAVRSKNAEVLRYASCYGSPPIDDVALIHTSDENTRTTFSSTTVFGVEETGLYD